MTDAKAKQVLERMIEEEERPRYCSDKGAEGEHRIKAEALRYVFATLDRVLGLLVVWETQAATTPLGEEAPKRYMSAYNVVIDKARELRAALEGKR